MNSLVPARSAAPTRHARALGVSLCVATLIAAASGGAVSAAEPPAEVHVRYGDLNLASDAGTQSLLHRLSAAAHRLCDDRGSRELARVVRAEACFRETLEAAVVAVHNERLSTLYHARAPGGAT
jgi:UrcA family protein